MDLFKNMTKNEIEIADPEMDFTANIFKILQAGMRKS